MIEIKRLYQCTIEDCVSAWNVGFEGYYFDATTTPEKFIHRLVSEDLSPTLSIVAFLDKKPVGIVKTGVRELNGKKFAWNGGTGVALELRNKGIGRMLMEATLAILEEEKVDTASLEAILENDKAISLYEKMGYEVIDQLDYLQLKGALNGSRKHVSCEQYQVIQTVPQKVAELPFYKGMNPWQTQWQSAKGGEAVILTEADGTEIGYAYFRKGYNPEGEHVSTVLYQCEAADGRADANDIIHCLLSEVFGSLDDEISRIVPNIPIEKSKRTHAILSEVGFKPITKQVYMMKKMDKAR